jgi:hypothetical protein
MQSSLGVIGGKQGSVPWVTREQGDGKGWITGLPQEPGSPSPSPCQASLISMPFSSKDSMLPVLVRGRPLVPCHRLPSFSGGLFRPLGFRPPQCLRILSPSSPLLESDEAGRSVVLTGQDLKGPGVPSYLGPSASLTCLPRERVR